MKKAVIFIQLLFIVIINNFADTLNVKLETNFRLNPITGINGEKEEASSKFVQRLLFSPLVFPLADPYLQDNYPIALSLSLIEGLEYRDIAGNWIQYDLSNYERNPGSSSRNFRINLRPNLHFNKIDNRRRRFKWDNLDVEDVVYSYRIARITMDRAYKIYFSQNNRNLDPQNKTNLGLNTLLYSKIRSFNDVYCDTDKNRYIYFEIDSNKNCKQFLELLVYVPVLSAMQINNQNLKTQPTSPIYRSLHSNLSFKTIFEQIESKDFDIYDINKLLLRPNGRYNDRGEDFYTHPVGYGQYLIEYPNQSFGSNDPDIWKKIFLVKNPDWCSNFSEGSRKRIGSQIFNHNDYSNDQERLVVEKSDDWDPQVLINNLKSSSEIIYNMALSATLFNDPDAIKNISANAEKRKMQISHSLYGVFFGPALGGDQAMMPTTRKFFSLFADRIRIENIVKYLPATGVGEAEEFDSLIRPEIENNEKRLTHDLQMQKLYFPFWVNVGETGEISSGLGELYTELEKRDMFFQEFFSAINRTTLRQFYATIMNNYPVRGRFFDMWIGGNDYPSEIKDELIRQYNQNSRFILSEPGKIAIEVFYEENDKIGMAIANHFVNVMDQFFKRGVRINSTNIKAVPFSRNWQNRAKDNAKRKILSFLVKGWNYKFDLLDEIKNQFIDPQSIMYVEDQYNQLILGRLSADRVTQYIAQSFYDNNIIIPLLGIQKYAIYYTQQDEKHFFDGIDPKIEIMLLPFYWRKK